MPYLEYYATIPMVREALLSYYAHLRILGQIHELSDIETLGHIYCTSSMLGGYRVGRTYFNTSDS